MRREYRRAARHAILIAACLLLLLTLAIAVSADEEEEEPVLYDLCVGGVQVTSENAEDVLGNGYVVFDSQSNTLTVSGGEITGFDLNAGAPHSITSTDEKVPVRVVVPGGSSVTFSYGVYLASGSFTAGSGEGQGADLTFLSQATEDGALSTGLVRVADGDIQIENCVVTCDAPNVTKDLFSAGKIVFNDSMFSVMPRGAVPAEYGSVFFAESELSMNHIFLVYTTDTVTADALFSSDGALTAQNCSVLVSGVGTVVRSGKGLLHIDGSSFNAFDVLHGFSVGGGCVISDSDIIVKSVYDGFVFSGEGSTDSILDSHIKLQSIPYETYVNRILLPRRDILRARGEEDIYLASVEADYQSHLSRDRHTGLYADGVDLTFENSMLTVTDYAFGILYRSRGHKFRIGDYTSVRVSAAKAAMIAVGETTDDVKFGSRTYGGHKLVKAADDNLGEMGKVVFYLTWDTGFVSRKNEDTPATFTDILNSFAYFTATCNMNIREVSVMSLVIPCLLFAIATLGVIAGYFAFRARAAKRGAGTDTDSRDKDNGNA